MADWMMHSLPLIAVGYADPRPRTAANQQVKRRQLPDIEDPPDDGTDDSDDAAQAHAGNATAVNEMASLRSDFISDSSDVETEQPLLASAQQQNRPAIPIIVDSDDDDDNGVGLPGRLRHETRQQPPQPKAAKGQVCGDICSDSSDLDDGLHLPADVVGKAMTSASHHHGTDAAVVDVDCIPVLERKRRKNKAASTKGNAKRATDVRF